MRWLVLQTWMLARDNVAYKIAPFHLQPFARNPRTVGLILRDSSEAQQTILDRLNKVNIFPNEIVRFWGVFLNGTNVLRLGPSIPAFCHSASSSSSSSSESLFLAYFCCIALLPMMGVGNVFSFSFSSTPTLLLFSDVTLLRCLLQGLTHNTARHFSELGCKTYAGVLAWVPI